MAGGFEEPVTRSSEMLARAPLPYPSNTTVKWVGMCGVGLGKIFVNHMNAK
jgi:hypothetical protein